MGIFPHLWSLFAPIWWQHNADLCCAESLWSPRALLVIPRPAGCPDSHTQVTEPLPCQTSLPWACFPPLRLSLSVQLCSTDLPQNICGKRTLFSLQVIKCFWTVSKLLMITKGLLSRFLMAPYICINILL